MEACDGVWQVFARIAPPHLVHTLIHCIGWLVRDEQGGGDAQNHIPAGDGLQGKARACQAPGRSGRGRGC